jgi:diamine N-acetyltransferase
MLHQVYCSIDETNLESQKLFENLGFVLSGKRKDWLKTAEGYLDVLEYQFMSQTNLKATPPFKGE